MDGGDAVPHQGAASVWSYVARFYIERGALPACGGLQQWCVEDEVVPVNDVMQAECVKVFPRTAGNFAEAFIHKGEAAVGICYGDRGSRLCEDRLQLPVVTLPQGYLASGHIEILLFHRSSDAAECFMQRSRTAHH